MKIEIKGLTDKKTAPTKKSGGGLKKLGMPRGSKKLGSPPSGTPSSAPEETEKDNKELEDIFSSPAPAASEESGGGLLDF
mmetsp:Transcript_11180/g.11141  ORF Transcript_11180/g.11141 Transcript_11180/m.11141 type:complete len:80 (+) Transcript_11180:467-706(+)|eukprot:CAMPEP_0197004210 /NCGR_PEP_ID=MMETSP1380-20130617/20415_1 /TAXON_ID=5936 /ORGANISM="Euplotes crassus, Strain CT5" /LENGTH=79 /DNA_ID=CAMNT_0042422929 /DNA_START=467 /DNA_END=706 /DNA_ORIENTATION=+